MRMVTADVTPGGALPAVVPADERSAAEGGVAAALQIQVALPYAPGRQLPHTEHRRGQAGGGAATANG